MANNRITRRTRWWGGGAGLASGAVVTAAVIGIGVTQVGGASPVHPLSTLVHLLADPAFPNGPGPDAFTLGGFTFDPVTSIPDCLGVGLCTLGAEGWATFDPPLAAVPPLFNANGGEADGISLATQYFDIIPTTGTDAGKVVGSMTTVESVIQILGQTSYAFTVTGAPTAVLGYTGPLPADGTVYDIFKFNLLPSIIVPHFTNVYEATPGGGVSDVMVLPSGQYSIASPVPLNSSGAELNLESLLTQNFSSTTPPADLDPAAAFSNLVATSNDSSIGPDAFTINVPGFDYQLDPFVSLTANDYAAAPIVALFGPALAAAGANALGTSAITQGFNVYNSAGTKVGSFDADETVTKLLGLTTVNELTTNCSLLGTCPPVGTDFSVTNMTPWNIGINDVIYLATPGGTATDTFITPTGSYTLPAPYNVDAAGNGEINPESVFASLVAEQPMAQLVTPPSAELGPSTPCTMCFTIDDQTFYPETSSSTEGWNNMSMTLGGPPLLAAFGGQVFGTITLDTQEVWIYSGTGASATEEGAMDGNMVAVFLPFIQSASWDVTGCVSGTCPADQTYFAVTSLPGGLNNVFEGTPSGSVFDELITPLGPLALIDLPSPLMNPAVDFVPSDLNLAGLDVPGL